MDAQYMLMPHTPQPSGESRDSG